MAILLAKSGCSSQPLLYDLTKIPDHRNPESLTITIIHNATNPILSGLTRACQLCFSASAASSVYSVQLVHCIFSKIYSEDSLLGWLLLKVFALTLYALDLHPFSFLISLHPETTIVWFH